MKLFLKKFLVLSSLIVTVFAFSNLFLASPSFAEGAYFEGRTSNCTNFLGLTSWDCGVNISNEDTLKSGIWLIVLNIATDITVLSAYLVLGFVIYGGYQYMFSGGDAGRVANGKKTLINAFIGLTIVMSAHIIMSTIRIVLTANGGNIADCVNQSCVGPDANQMVTNLIQWVVGIAGIIAAIFLIYGGVSYMTSSGDASKVKKAKETILYALIGLAIVALAEIITAFVSGIIRDSSNAYINNSNITTISKEVS